MWQVLKAHGGAEHLVMHIHDLVLVTARVQVVHCVLDDVQSLMARCLQVVLGRQVGPEGARQAGVVAQVAALWGQNVINNREKEKNVRKYKIEIKAG